MEFKRDQKILERKEAKSADYLFVNAVSKFERFNFHRGFGRFIKSARKGHVEAVWIRSVIDSVSRVDLEFKFKAEVLIDAFLATDCPMGWFWAGMICRDTDQRIAYLKQSSNSGYTLARIVLARYIYLDLSLRKEGIIAWKPLADEKNPFAMAELGSDLYRNNIDVCTAELLLMSAAESGHAEAAAELCELYSQKHDMLKLAQYSPLSESETRYFSHCLNTAIIHSEYRTTQCDFNVLMMYLGKGLYWRKSLMRIQYTDDEVQKFKLQCLEYYCSKIDLQQAAIFTFLLCWKRATYALKGIGIVIAKMVWDGRYENLIISDDTPVIRKSRRLAKRICK